MDLNVLSIINLKSRLTYTALNLAIFTEPIKFVLQSFRNSSRFIQFSPIVEKEEKAIKKMNRNKSLSSKSIPFLWFGLLQILLRIFIHISNFYSSSFLFTVLQNFPSSLLPHQIFIILEERNKEPCRYSSNVMEKFTSFLWIFEENAMNLNVSKKRAQVKCFGRIPMSVTSFVLFLYCAS